MEGIGRLRRKVSGFRTDALAPHDRTAVGDDDPDRRAARRRHGATLVNIPDLSSFDPRILLLVVPLLVIEVGLLCSL